MSSIKIVQGNIVELSVDFVVNAANRRLAFGSGVCEDIFKGAGVERLQAACDKIGVCPVGGAVLTPGFNLPAKYIIHAVGPHWHGGSSGEEEKLYSCYWSSLDLVRENEGHSIAFPIISSGVYGYPKEEAWRVAVRAVVDYQQRHRDYDIDVIFAVRSHGSYELGMSILAGVELEPESEKRHVRLYTLDNLHGIAEGRATFIAEFADEKVAANYCQYMQGKKRYAGKFIAIAEVPADETIREDDIHTVLTPIGETLDWRTREF